MSEAIETSDIIIVGTGAAGLASALALAQAGWRTTLVGRPDLRPTARTVALFDRSLRLFENLGVIERLRPDFAALETMRIVDDTGSLFRTPPVEFRAPEIGLDVFGENIENHLLLAHLLEAVRATPGLTLVDGEATHAMSDETGVDVLLDDGGQLRAGLVVAADGRKSKIRKAAGIHTREWSYPQVALTALMRHERPHHEVSTEFHTRQGPFTMVPLPAKPGAPHRSSLVWMMDPREARRHQAMDDATLAQAINQQSHFLLGRVTLEGPRGAFPMSGLVAESFAARRTALVGDAAHGFPPIGAQGLNLGLRDVAHLVDSLTPGEDPGGAEALARYQASRVSDVRSRVAGVDVLNRSLLTGLLPVDALRGLGLLALANLRPLRRMIMREGVAPRGIAPRLMRAQNIANRL